MYAYVVWVSASLFTRLACAQSNRPLPEKKNAFFRPSSMLHAKKTCFRRIIKNQNIRFLANIAQVPHCPRSESRGITAHRQNVLSCPCEVLAGRCQQAYCFEWGKKPQMKKNRHFIPARRTKKCVVRMLQNRWTGPKLISGQWLQASRTRATLAALAMKNNKETKSYSWKFPLRRSLQKILCRISLRGVL